MSQNYDDSSIDVLHGAERIRTRPASMLGSDGLSGARHGFTEIYGNALDEHSAGFGNQIDVKCYSDGSISVRDYGRGVPLGWNSKAGVMNWNWHNIYNELYGGGKYESNQAKLAMVTDWSKFNPKDFVYLYSVGLNGLGAASTQYTSEFFEVRSYRGGICTSRTFRHGNPIVNGAEYNMFTASRDEIQAIPQEMCKTDEPDGTFIRWKPDSAVFTEVDINRDEWVLGVCKDVAGVSGIKLVYDDEVSGRHVEFDPGTLSDVLIGHAADNMLEDDSGRPAVYNASKFTHGVVDAHIADNMDMKLITVCQCDISIGLTRAEVPMSCYHNEIRMMSGVQYEAAKRACHAFLSEKAKGFGVAKVFEQDCFCYITVAVSTHSNYASFRNQTKDAIDDMYIYNAVYQCVKEKLEIEYAKGTRTIRSLVDRVVEDSQTRVQVEQYRKQAQQMNKIKREKAPAKFVSCDAYEARRYNEVELWITEGDSALGAVKSARDRRFQALYPIRGKGINVAKATPKRIFANKEVREIFSILGTGFDVPQLRNEKFFNIEDLKVGKIVIATDADEDGYQIRVLMFLMFYKLAPQLLLHGKVFIAETPRFCLTIRGGSRIFARNDEERDRVKEEYQGQITNIARYKGLGEVNPSVLRETTVHPDTRNLVPVTCDISNNTERDLIDALFGADRYKQRKSIISAVLGSNVLDLIEDYALSIEEDDDEC